MKQEVEGHILWLRCSACSSEFPVFVFSGDNDWVTANLRTRTDVDTKTLFIAGDSDDRPTGAEIELVTVEHVKSKPGESFQEYRERSKDRKDRYIYRCVSCATGYAEDLARISQDELVSRGYKLVNLVE